MNTIHALSEFQPPKTRHVSDFVWSAFAGVFDWNNLWRDLGTSLLVKVLRYGSEPVEQPRVSKASCPTLSTWIGCLQPLGSVLFHVKGEERRRKKKVDWSAHFIRHHPFRGPLEHTLVVSLSKLGLHSSRGCKQDLELGNVSDEFQYSSGKGGWKSAGPHLR